MSTPEGKFFDRDLARAFAKPFAEVGGPVLREVVDFGLNVFLRCSRTAKGKDENLGILFPLLHLLEMIDGAEVLLETGATAPATVLMRSAFEALLALEYVAKDPDKTVARGTAYVVADIHRRLKEGDRIDPASQRGKQFRAALAKDSLAKNVTLPSVPDLSKRLARLQSALSKPHLKPAADEYERTRKRLGKHPPFHALWGGPADVEQLAAHLERAGLYEILYRTWSRTTHAMDLPRQLQSVDGTLAVKRLRSSEDIHTVYGFAIGLGLIAIRTVLTHYRPDELPDLARWYQEKVRTGYLRLGRFELEEYKAGT